MVDLVELWWPLMLFKVYIVFIHVMPHLIIEPELSSFSFLMSQLESEGIVQQWLRVLSFYNLSPGSYSLRGASIT